MKIIDKSKFTETAVNAAIMKGDYVYHKLKDEFAVVLKVFDDDLLLCRLFSGEVQPLSRHLLTVESAIYREARAAQNTLT